MKAAKDKARATAAVNEQDDDEDVEEEEEDEDETEQPSTDHFPTATAKRINFLDPAIFQDAATYFEPEKQPAAGQGKMAAKKRARAEKRAKREAAEERAAQVATGGARQVE